MTKKVTELKVGDIITHHYRGFRCAHLILKIHYFDNIFKHANIDFITLCHYNKHLVGTIGTCSTIQTDNYVIIP